MIEHPDRKTAQLAYNAEIQTLLNARLAHLVHPTPVSHFDPNKEELEKQYQIDLEIYKREWTSTHKAFWADVALITEVHNKHGFFPCDPVGTVVPHGWQWIGPPPPASDYDPIRDMPGPKKMVWIR